ncbi:hypothetical protein F8M41_012892 [Gigaspora margarita]|nr:hypothetical protein F8M41_012892 [Gigaspora margarita]
MPLYNLSTIIYIVLQFISIFLLGVLVFALLTSTPQFSHTTLLQLFISAFLFNSIGLLPLLMFGDDLKIIGVHSLLCIICQKFTAFLFLPTHIFPVVLVFYLWYALVRGDLRIEQKCLYYVSGTVWLYTICNSIASILIERNHDNFGTTVSLYMCVEVFGDRRYYGYVIPNMILTGLSIPMSCHSGYILWKRWKTFSSNQNRSTAIKLGHSVRLCVFSSISSVFLMATLIPRMIMYHETNPILQYILAFSTALL